MNARNSIVIATAAALSLLVMGCASESGPPRLGDVRGRYILTISDVDMDATAFADSKLGEHEPGQVDELTVFALPLREPQTPWAHVPVSNSAAGPPTAMDVSPDRRTAFIAEARGPAPSGATVFGDLPPGRFVTAVDMTDPLSPKFLDKIDVGPDPTAVSVHPDGDLIAVVRRSDDRNQLAILTFKDGRFGDWYKWPLIGLDDDSATPSCVAWHPSGRFLAVTLPTRNEVMFYEFSRTGDTGTLSLAPWGEPVKVGKYPYSGRFTPDGRYFITTDLQWGPEVEGFNVGPSAGQLTVIRVGDTSAAPEDVHHEVVSTVPVGISPEGLAISPNGRYVVTSNLRQSFLPADDPRLKSTETGGSLALLRLNPDSGVLTPLGEYPMVGMPEGIAFDAAGRMVVVAQFRSLDPKVHAGELGFWRLDTGSTPRLEQAPFFLNVGRGPHEVMVVP